MLVDKRVTEGNLLIITRVNSSKTAQQRFWMMSANHFLYSTEILIWGHISSRVDSVQIISGIVTDNYCSDSKVTELQSLPKK